MFTTDAKYQIQQPNAQYFASQMINLEWVQPGSGEHRIFPSGSDITDAAGHVLVTSYAVLRPDGEWSLMLVNKDQENAYPVRILFQDEKRGEEKFFAGPVSMVTFGREQYQWHSNTKLGLGYSETGDDRHEANVGHADPDGPAARSTIAATDQTSFQLPKSSVTVLRGKLSAPPTPGKGAK
jgi:hypothetical protein